MALALFALGHPILQTQLFKSLFKGFLPSKQTGRSQKMFYVRISAKNNGLQIPDDSSSLYMSKRSL